MLNKVGELFIVGFRGLELPVWLREFAERYGLGGVILFDYDVASKSYQRNVVSPAQVKMLCQQLAELPARPLICIDQEGGRVRRLKEELGFCPYPSAADFARLSRQERLFLTRQSFRELRNLGIHYTLAPVIDINCNPNNPDIGAIGRSYAADAGQVSENVSILAEVAREVNLGLCVKHFPGIGASTVNSHDEPMVIDIDDQQLELFFRWGNDINGRAILVSHAYSEWDKNYPLSLSKRTVEQVRRVCGDVLLLTDDLQMQGIQKVFGSDSAIELAVRAGIDMVIFGNNLLLEEQQMCGFAERIEKLLFDDRALQQQVETSIERISGRKNSLYHSS